MQFMLYNSLFFQCCQTFGYSVPFPYYFSSNKPAFFQAQISSVREPQLLTQGRRFDIELHSMYYRLISKHHMQETHISSLKHNIS